MARIQYNRDRGNYLVFSEAENCSLRREVEETGFSSFPRNREWAHGSCGADVGSVAFPFFFQVFPHKYLGCIDLYFI